MRVSWSRTRWAAIGAAVAIAVGSGTLAFVTASGGGTASSFVPITPCRLIDTRSTSPVGPRSTPILAGESLTVQVTGSNGQCVIPASATAIVINVTAVGPTVPGYITLYPADVALPNASNLNFTANQSPTPNLVTVSLSTTGAIKIFNVAGTVNVLGDIAGYYQPDNGLANAGAACNVNGLAGVIVNGVDTNHNASSKCFTSLVTTLAGFGGSGNGDGVGNDSAFASPAAVAVDTVGNIYVAEQFANRIRRITGDGVVTTLAGTGASGSIDGPGATATFNQPSGIAVDAVGNVYVADSQGHIIRKITAAGVVSTFAGSGAPGFSDGTGVAAQFNYPQGVAVDAAGNVYVVESINNRVRKITSAGVVTTLAGTGASGSNNGPGATATFNQPYGVAVDAVGNVYVADYGNHRIRKVTAAGVVTTLAGSTAGYIDASATAAQFTLPSSVAVDAVGNVYVADSGNYRIRKVTAAGVVTTVAGSGTSGHSDGIGTAAQFVSPYGVAVDNSGTIFVADWANYRIRRIN